MSWSLDGTSWKDSGHQQCCTGQSISVWRLPSLHRLNADEHNIPRKVTVKAKTSQSIQTTEVGKNIIEELMHSDGLQVHHRLVRITVRVAMQPMLSVLEHTYNVLTHE
jgi:hypothetical protein